MGREQQPTKPSRSDPVARGGDAAKGTDVRIELRPPGEVEPASVWAVLAEPAEGPVTFTLLHDYGDALVPVAGSTIATAGRQFSVVSVAGRVLACEEIFS